jgi:hypothetical protein
VFNPLAIRVIAGDCIAIGTRKHCVGWVNVPLSISSCQGVKFLCQITVIINISRWQNVTIEFQIDMNPAHSSRCRNVGIYLFTVSRLALEPIQPPT